MSNPAVKRPGSLSDEPDECKEDPKLMPLVEADSVSGLDDKLHLQGRKKKHKKHRTMEGDTQPSKENKQAVMNKDDYIVSRIISHLNKPSKHEAYRNSLMLSEWFVELPDDFEENWIMIPCPTGKRMLIVAALEVTRCFSKSGHFLYFFQSALPGGHFVGIDESSKSLTILDCIWHYENETYYVLDVLAWNACHFEHCEAKFRFLWLQQKMSELGTSLDVSENNHFRFSFLLRVACKKDELVHTMNSSFFKDEFQGIIDGVLFYDASAPYFCGVSSTVGWLKPFMIPEVFGVPASPVFLADCPDDYVNVEQYIGEFEEKREEVLRKERELRSQRSMEKGSGECVRGDIQKDVKVEVEEIAPKKGNVRDDSEYEDKQKILDNPEA